MGRISALTELTSLASDDYLVVLDSSANIAKKITIANAFGLTDNGFVATGESWTYSAYSSTTRIAEITVPTDATTKYYNGMRVKFTQPTDGVKYGIVMKVEATKLHIFMKSGNDLDNEAITSPLYSTSYAPAGFNLDPTLWQLTYDSVANVTQNTPTNGTWYNLGTTLLATGVGAYNLGYHTNLYETTTAAGQPSAYVTLSTANNSESDAQMTGRIYNSYGLGTLAAMNSVARNKDINNSSATTYYLNAKVDNTSGSTLNFYGGQGGTRIYARCKYI